MQRLLLAWVVASSVACGSSNDPANPSNDGGGAHDDAATDSTSSCGPAQGPWTSDEIAKPQVLDVALATAASAPFALTAEGKDPTLQSLFFHASSGASWSSESILSAGTRFWRLFAFADASGAPQLVYSLSVGSGSIERIAHASKDSAGWHEELVCCTTSGMFAGTPSLEEMTAAMGSDGALHAAFSVDNSLLHAVRGSSGWTLEAIAEGHRDSSTAPSGRFPAMAVDPSGKVHVAAIDEWTDQLVDYAQDGATWKETTIAPAPRNQLQNLAMTFASDGTAHVVWFDAMTKQIRHATGMGGTWALDTVDQLEDKAYSTRIGVTASAGKIDVLYDNSSCLQLRHASFAAGAWSIEQVGKMRKFSGPSFDGAGKLHAAYVDDATRDATHAVR